MISGTRIGKLLLERDALVAALEALHRATIEPTLYMSEGDLNATQKKMRANALDRYADACELTATALKSSQVQP